MIPEILAPAGSAESLTAALRCGADAVYLGAKDFSARQNAENFDLDGIKNSAELCHLYGAKLYLTVNTLLFESQLSDFQKLIKRSAELGADAFIVQDLGAAYIIKNTVPDIPLHASTQMTIHSPSGAEFAKRLGFTRIVAARELSKEQLAELCAVGIEIEMFVHGALCMSVSGQCLMSAMIGSRSANRGNCAQSCRLPFSAKGDGYALSLKDLSLVRYASEIAEMGISSLKIEGRMKRPEYTAAAVTALRTALNGEEPDLESLNAAFSRSGFTDGYFRGKLGSKMFGTRGKDDVIASNEIIPKLRALYKDEAKKTEISFNASFSEENIILCANDSESNAVCINRIAENITSSHILDEQSVRKQLSRLGGTIYLLKDIQCSFDGEVSLPVSALNELRRSAVEALSNERIKNNTPVYRITDYSITAGKKPHGTSETRLRLEVYKFSQLKKIMQEIPDKIDKIILPLEEAENNSAMPEFIRKKVIISPPRFIPNEAYISDKLKMLKNSGFDKLYCTNAAYIETGKKLGFELFGGVGLNAANSLSLKALSELGLKDTVLSAELKFTQITSLNSDIPLGIIAYGRLPLMLTRNCPIKSEIGCKNCGGILIDRTKRKFYVKCPDISGCAEILNSEKIFLADKLSDIKGISFLQLMFYEETADDVLEIAKGYLSGQNAPENITRGLYYRGVI